MKSTRGTISTDVEGALIEMYAQSKATACKNFMLSISLSPPPEELVPEEDFDAAIEQIEESLGLVRQQRVVIYHEKNARRHCHVVYSRIDPDEMKAINLPFFKERLFEIAREQYLIHGWPMPDGFRNLSLSSPLNYTLEEYQIAKRAKRDPREIKATLIECWERSDGREAFEAALEDQGFYLARGDRRGFVLLDWKGNIYALSRWINQRAKTLEAKLGPPEKARSLNDQRDELAGALNEKRVSFIVELDAQFQLDMRMLEVERQRIVANQRKERTKLLSIQKDRREQEASDRSAQLRKGLLGLWDWITGNRARIRALNAQLDTAAKIRDQVEYQDLIANQKCKIMNINNKRNDLGHQYEYSISLISNDTNNLAYKNSFKRYNYMTMDHSL